MSSARDLLFALLILACPFGSSQGQGHRGGVILFGDSTSLSFDDVSASCVFFGGGKGGIDTTGFPVRLDTGWAHIPWGGIMSLDVLGGQYGKLERWPCLRDAEVDVVMRNDSHVRDTVDCLFWMEVILAPDESGMIEKRTVRFFTPQGTLNIRKITLE